jgi:hypothetical protein
VRRAGFHPLRAPTTNLPVGTIAVVWRADPVSMTLVCRPAQWLGEEGPTPEIGGGPDARYRREFAAALEAEIRENVAEVGVEGRWASRIEVEIANLRYESLAQADVERTAVRDAACVQAVRRWQSRGVRVAAIVGAYRADVRVRARSSLAADVEGEGDLPVLGGGCPEPRPRRAAGADGLDAPARERTSSIELGVGLTFSRTESTLIAGAEVVWGIQYLELPTVGESGEIGVRVVR